MKQSPAERVWARARALVEEAEALPDDSRHGFLSEALERDPELGSLLGAAEPRETFLEPLGASAFDAFLLETPAELPAGGAFAGYEIVNVVGSGASSVVYRALQEKPVRTVALKVLRGAVIDGRLLRRFEFESELLARLRHPNIVPVFEAGAADGPLGPQPYIAMEFVEGLPITRYVRDERLGVDDTIDLFVKVCCAVQHAHQRSVVHRDLKPANILVEPDGTPRVLDFGVARVVSSDSPATLATRAGELIGTIPYMSPEQVTCSADAIDARSDVYALGVILFELLTGARPYTIGDAGLGAAAKVICERMPPSPGSFRRELRGDLSTVVLKALQKDPEQRYASAAALSDDLERVTRREPILGRPPSAAYHLRKLIGRHAIASTLLATLVLSLVVFSVWMSALYRESESLRSLAEIRRTEAVDARDAEEDARLEAERQTETTRAVQQFMSDILTAPDPSRGSNVTVREALDRGVRQLEGKTVASPGITSAIRTNLARGYYGLREFDRAAEQYERAYQERFERLGADHPLTARSAFDLGRTLRVLGRRDKAAAMLRQSIESWRRAPGDDTALIVEAMTWLGLNLLEQERPGEAETLLEEAVELNASTRDPDARRLARLRRHLGHVYAQQRRYAEADAAYMEAAEYRGRAGAVVGRGENLRSAAAVRVRRGDLPAAREAIRMWRETTPPVSAAPHPSTVVMACRISHLMRDTGLDADADALLREIIDVARATNDVRIRVHARDAAFTRGSDASRERAFGDAERWLRASLELSRGDGSEVPRMPGRTIGDSESHVLGQTHLRLAECLLRLDRRDEALEQLALAERVVATLPDGHALRADARALRDECERATSSSR